MKLLYHGRAYKADWDKLPRSEEFKLGESEAEVDEVTYVMERVDYILPPSSCSGWVRPAPPGRGPFAGKRCASTSSSTEVKSLRRGETWQHAWLMRPSQKGATTCVWLIFGGNGMLATDWTDFCEDLLKSDPRKGAAFLLFDLPGYGANGGTPSPESVLTSNLRGLSEALSLLGGEPTVHLLGHSIGAAVASQLAVALSDKGQQPGELLMTAPFLSVPHMAERFTEQLRLHSPLLKKLPKRAFRLVQLAVCAACPHRWDNSTKVPLAVKAGWKLRILHGRKDRMCPMEMGLKLFEVADEAAKTCGADQVIFTQAQAGHNDLMRIAFADYAVAMGFPKPKPPKSLKHVGNGMQVQHQQPQEQPSQQEAQMVDQRLDAIGETDAEKMAQDEKARRSSNSEKRHDSLDALRGGVPGVNLIVQT